MSQAWESAPDGRVKVSSLALTRYGTPVTVGMRYRGFAGLSALGRYLTGLELTGFLFRHPLIATRISATKVVIAAGMYANINNASWWNDFAWFYGFDPKVGLIPTYGLTVNDSTLGRVTVFPSEHDVLLTTDNPVYNPGNTNNPYPGDIDPSEWQGPSLPQIGFGLGALAILGIGLWAVSR